MKTIKEVKEELKVKADKIRSLKAKRKEVPFGFVRGLKEASAEYRHQHIAYCMARGRQMGEIEPDSQTGNPNYEAPNWASVMIYADRIKPYEQPEEVEDEAVCCC